LRDWDGTLERIQHARCVSRKGAKQAPQLRSSTAKACRRLHPLRNAPHHGSVAWL